jgi:prenyltransferase beta subunit
MLQVARLAPKLLGESGDLVRGFLHRSMNADGAFRDRSGDSDLYYTVFGLEGLLALGEPTPEATRAYLEQFGDGSSLDFVHLTCLVRAWASVSRTGPPGESRFRMRERIESFRSADGGYATGAGAADGTPYACFLALGAIEDLAMRPADPEDMLRCLERNRAADGGYANHPDAGEGSTPATAAAVVVLRHLEREPERAVADWLLSRCHADGGFFAAPRAPMPDLLSTATALHALTAMHVDLSPVREPCLDFVDTLWTNTGGFCGSWADGALDCEYTYYGLLALGHLAL